MKYFAVAAALAGNAAITTEASPLSDGPWGERNPVAPDEAVVVSGGARFTVLTDRLVRLEYGEADADGAYHFEDRATVAFINRNPETVPEFTQSTDDAGLPRNAAASHRLPTVRAFRGRSLHRIDCQKVQEFVCTRPHY